MPRNAPETDRAICMAKGVHTHNVCVNNTTWGLAQSCYHRIANHKEVEVTTYVNSK